MVTCSALGRKGSLNLSIILFVEAPDSFLLKTILFVGYFIEYCLWIHYSKKNTYNLNSVSGVLFLEIISCLEHMHHLIVVSFINSFNYLF